MAAGVCRYYAGNSSTFVQFVRRIEKTYRWTSLIRSPKGKGKWFKLTGVRINEVKISSKALQGE